jgi:hypothetical protein
MDAKQFYAARESALAARRSIDLIRTDTDFNALVQHWTSFVGEFYRAFSRLAIGAKKGPSADFMKTISKEREATHC